MIHSQQCVSIYQPLKNERKKHIQTKPQRNKIQQRNSAQPFYIYSRLNDQFRHTCTCTHKHFHTTIQSQHQNEAKASPKSIALHCIATNTSEAKITIESICAITFFFFSRHQPILFKCITTTTSNVLIGLFYFFSLMNLRFSLRKKSTHYPIHKRQTIYSTSLQMFIVESKRELG